MKFISSKRLPVPEEWLPWSYKIPEGTDKYLQMRKLRETLPEVTLDESSGCNLRTHSLRGKDEAGLHCC